MNSQAHSLVVLASLLLPHLDSKNGTYKVEMIYRPSVLDNVEHWQVFEDDAHIKEFMACVKDFTATHFEGLNGEDKKSPQET